MTSAATGAVRRPAVLLTAAAIGAIGAIGASYLLLDAGNVSFSEASTVPPATGAALRSSNTEITRSTSSGAGTDTAAPTDQSPVAVSPSTAGDPAGPAVVDDGTPDPAPDDAGTTDGTSNSSADGTAIETEPADCPPPLSVTFADGTSEPIVDGDVERQVDTLVAWLDDHPGIPVLVDGHADARGVDDLNLRLSFDRARAVAGLLQDRGVPADRLTARGFGEYQGLPGEPAESARNRRVEVRVAGYESCGLDDKAGVDR